MNKNENLKENEINEMEGVKEETISNENAMTIVQDFNSMMKQSNTKKQCFTNIRDDKKIFNLDTHVDYKLNDCKGEMIRVKEVLIKRFEKPLAEPEIEESTGEIIKDKEIKMVCILIDDNNQSYVTGSKIFTMQMMRYIENFGTNLMETSGLEIKIIEVDVKNSSNKALGFELV